LKAVLLELIRPLQKIYPGMDFPGLVWILSVTLLSDIITCDCIVSTFMPAIFTSQISLPPDPYDSVVPAITYQSIFSKPARTCDDLKGRCTIKKRQMLVRTCRIQCLQEYQPPHSQT
jgi:hypothetical protein